MNSVVKLAFTLAVSAFLAGGLARAGDLSVVKPGPTVESLIHQGNVVVPATFRPATGDRMSRRPEFQHGTHLCSADSHCGTGHKCCSGHCKAVSTCG